jgi:hypothetical protein
MNPAAHQRTAAENVTAQDNSLKRARPPGGAGGNNFLGVNPQSPPKSKPKGSVSVKGSSKINSGVHDFPAMDDPCTNRASCISRGFFCHLITVDHIDAVRNEVKRRYAYDDKDVHHFDGGKSKVDEYLLKFIRDGDPPLIKNYFRGTVFPCDYCFSALHCFRDCDLRDEAKSMCARKPSTIGEYFCPPEPNGRMLRVCTSFFSNLTGKRQAALNTLNTARRAGVDTVVRKEGSGRPPSIDVVELRRTLMDHKYEQSHYSCSSSKSSTMFFHEGDLSFFTFWKETLERIQPLFTAQCRRLRFFRTYHPKVRGTREHEPSAAAYLEDGGMIEPVISYGSAKKFYNTYDFKFRPLQTDRCDYCAKMIYECHNGDAAGMAAAKLDLIQHQQDAAYGYKLKAIDMENARINALIETLIIDLSAGKRTPYYQTSSPFFLMMKNSFIYLMCQASTGTDFTYLFDETMIDKGPNMVCSCLIKWVVQWKLAHPNVVLKVLNIWCDGCTAQVWNNYTAFFISLLTSPWSPYYICERCDLLRNPVGHTFLNCDAAGGLPNKAVMKRFRDQHFLGVITTFRDDRLDAIPNCTSWEDLIRVECPTLTLVVLKQADMMDVKTFVVGPGSIFRKTTPDHHGAPLDPNNTNNMYKWHDAHHLNFGVGDCNARTVVKHPGRIFARNRLRQDKSDEITIYNPSIVQLHPGPNHAAVVSTAAGNAMVGRVIEPWNGGVAKAMSYDKIKQLHEVGKKCIESVRVFFPAPVVVPEDDGEGGAAALDDDDFE